MNLELNLGFESKLGIPKIKINIDDYLTLYDGDVKPNMIFDFKCTPGEHELRITHYGKTVHDAANLNFDKHIQILSIKMDSVELQNELWNGKFYPVYLHSAKHEPVYIQPNLYLGHNGTWVMPFDYPCIDWLIRTRKQGPQLANTIFESTNDKLEIAKEFFSKATDV